MNGTTLRLSMASALLILVAGALCATDAVIEVGESGFRPAMHVLIAGSGVSWVHRGRASHELSDDRGFLRGEILPGGRAIHVDFPPDLVGDYSYRCLTHDRAGTISFVRDASTAVAEASPELPRTTEVEALPPEESTEDLMAILGSMLSALLGEDSPEELQKTGRRQPSSYERIPDPELEIARTRLDELYARLGESEGYQAREELATLRAALEMTADPEQREALLIDIEEQTSEVERLAARYRWKNEELARELERLEQGEQ